MLKNIDQLRLKAIYVQQLREGSSIDFTWEGRKLEHIFLFP